MVVAGLRCNHLFAGKLSNCFCAEGGGGGEGRGWGREGKWKRTDVCDLELEVR